MFKFLSFLKKNMQVADIDTERLQKAANEAAMKWALQTIEDYYTGHNSPYKQELTKQLNAKAFDCNLELPDVIALINGGITREIDVIANTAIAKTFLPLAQKLLTRAEKEANFSELLEAFVEATNWDCNEYEQYQYQCEINQEARLDTFKRVKVSVSDIVYEFSLYEVRETRELPDEEKKYTIVALPYRSTHNMYEKKMKISLDGGATLELPFTTEILHDQFLSQMARYIMANTVITIDRTNFKDEWFDEDDN